MDKSNQERKTAKKADASFRDNRPSGNDSPVIIVGVGASAGSLKSLKQLFAKMPTGHGVAFVLVRHLKSKRKTHTVKLLAEQTEFAVVEATDGMPVLPDRIHVIPPDKYLSISGNMLTTREPVLCNGLWMPIDHFFCSFAEDQSGRSVGILLSGMGSDGILGLSEIRAAGGRTFVEDPGDAEYSDTPQSAIDAGVADTVLTVKAMADAITALADKVTAGTRNVQTYPPEFDADLRVILEILRIKVGHDFLCYKPNTIIRRIRRRMGLADIPTFADYARFLHEHIKEVGLLQKDLLIGVTDFFRQPQAWEILEKKIIIPLVDGAQPGSEIRVWVPGCSTGQEAYSLAMALTEHVEKSGKKLTIQIFATDSDLTSLATARSGIYSQEDIGANVSSERLKRFFLRKDGHYQVVKDIREQIVFAPQNITADPPFSRLNLISCRNLLIYLDQEVQKKIIALFHFSLREGGSLFLGTAETVGDREELFEPVSKKWRIYHRIGVGRRVGVEIPTRPTVAYPPADFVGPVMAVSKGPLVPPPSRMSLASGAQHMLLDRFAPACVMIDRKLQVLYVHGSVEDYLTFPPGELTTRVVEMAREGLRARLRGAIAKCLQSNKSVSVTARVRRGSKSVAVKTVVSPLRYPREIDGLLLITFEDYRIPIAKTSSDTAATGDVRYLEDELKITREELQSTILQLENSNDELKASNEEVTAANEELQSANEEMETSKEELQSLNEELNTINVRLHDKVDELEGVNNDVVNLLSSTNIATVFLDKELRVKRYTPAITRFLSLIPTDVDRPIADILRHFTDETLLDDARRVLADLMPQDSEVHGDDGRWYIRRITPYRTQDDRIEGVVITFVDVAALKEAEESLRQFNEELEQRVSERTAELQAASLYTRSLIEAGLDPLVTISPEGRITDVNEATEQVTGRTRMELIGTDFSEYFTDPDSARTGYRNVLADGHVHDYPLTIRHTSGNTTDVLYNATVYRNQKGELQGVFAAARDVTELKRAEKALREANQTLEQRVAERTAELHESQHRLSVIVDSIADGFFAIDREWRFTHVNEEALRHFHKTREDVAGYMFFDVFPEARGGIFETKYRLAMESGEPVHFETPSIVSNLIMEIHAYPGPESLTVLFRDITEKQRMAAALREALDRAEWLGRFPEENPNPVMRVLADGNVLYRNPASVDIPGWAYEVGRQLADPLLPLLGQAIASCSVVQQDMELGRRFYSVTVVPIPEEGYANIYGRDVTERKHAEEALRKSEARFRLLSATAGRLLGIDDPQAIVEDLCREVMVHLDCQAFFNFLVDDEAGRLRLNACVGIPEEDARAIEWLDYGVAVCGCAAQARQRIIAEDIFHTPDVRTDLVKSYGIQAYCCHPLMAQDRLIGTLSFGTKTRPYFTAEDVELMRTVAAQVAVAMQRKQSEETVLRAKDEWERTFHAVPDLIAILDGRHRILRANKSMAERLGVAPEHCIGELCHKAVHGLDYPPDFCPHTQTLADGKEHITEVHEDCLGGDFLVSATPLTDERGRLIGSVHVARDITKRKKAEESLKERTAELEAVNSELESFSYSVSHDLRAPLRAIDGYARMILKTQGDNFDAETIRKFNVIRTNAQMMGQLIDDILALSRVVKKQLSVSKLDVDAIVREVWQELEIMNPERKMGFDLKSLSPAYGDRTLIKQVYFNLLANAVKFTKGRDRALIEAGGYIEGNEIVYYVRDNGAGFDMNYYDKLFGIFQRLHNADDFEGTGVGLATVQRIIQRHGGRVWAEAKVNEGATFYFSLPRKQ